jgi:hypothetical protein
MGRLYGKLVMSATATARPQDASRQGGACPLR